MEVPLVTKYIQTFNTILNGSWSSQLQFWQSFWKPFWMMIHVLLLQIKLGLISRKVTAGQKRLQDRIGLHPKLSDSQMCVPAKSGCQEKMDCQPKVAANLCWLPVKNGCQPKRPDQNGCFPKLAVKIG